MYLSWRRQKNSSLSSWLPPPFPTQAWNQLWKTHRSLAGELALVPVELDGDTAWARSQHYLWIKICPPRYQIWLQALLYSIQSCLGNWQMAENTRTYPTTHGWEDSKREPSRGQATHAQSPPLRSQNMSPLFPWGGAKGNYPFLALPKGWYFLCIGPR